MALLTKKRNVPAEIEAAQRDISAREAALREIGTSEVDRLQWLDMRIAANDSEVAAGELSVEQLRTLDAERDKLDAEALQLRPRVARLLPRRAAHAEGLTAARARLQELAGPHIRSAYDGKLDEAVRLLGDAFDLIVAADDERMALAVELGLRPSHDPRFTNTHDLAAVIARLVGGKDGTLVTAASWAARRRSA